MNIRQYILTGFREPEYEIIQDSGKIEITVLVDKCMFTPRGDIDSWKKFIDNLIMENNWSKNNLTAYYEDQDKQTGYITRIKFY